ncbi:MAG: hypothetical protein NT062_29745 [Proteobacteria bacterium]|nr:hypothetical protein [Pseudomonadota bacterium]
MGSEAVAQGMEQPSRQPGAAADPLDRLVGLVVGLRRAVEVPHDQAIADDTHPLERVVQPRRHRNRPPGAALGRRRLLVPGLKVHRDRSRDHVDVFTPAQGFHLADA